MGITESMRRLSAGVARAFAGTASGDPTYHLRVRVKGAMNGSTGQRAVTEEDYAITGFCVPFAIDQGFAAGGAGSKRPVEERNLCITRQALVDAGMDLDLKGPDISSCIIENKDTALARVLEIVESDLINGGTMFRVRTRQARFGNQP